MVVKRIIGIQRWTSLGLIMYIKQCPSKPLRPSMNVIALN